MKPAARLQLLHRIGRLGVTAEMDFKAASKVTITNLAACAHVLFTLPYYWYFRGLGAGQLAILVLPLAGLFALIPLINGAGYTLLSRHLLLGVINVNVYLFTASLGLQSSIQNVFFFTLISPLMLFALHQWRSILVSVLQPIVLSALLLWKGAWLVPTIQLEPWAYAALRPAISLTTALMLFSCLGNDGPTVILEAMGDGTSVNWAWVQPQIAEMTRVCAYDGAGRGWSESSPAPRDALHIAQELRGLLANAGEVPPFVLVGHSFGKFVTRMYAAAFPHEVAGMGIVDGGQPDIRSARFPAEGSRSRAQGARAWRSPRLNPLLARARKTSACPGARSRALETGATCRDEWR